ncbi:MAG: GNAT family N-acetyltransferase [Chloroflexota bacterium]
MSILYGQRVRLRALERDDVSKFYDWVNDPEVTAGLTLYLPMSTLDEEKWFDGVLQHPQEERPLAIEIRDGEAWRLVGNCAFFDLDWIAHAGEFGIMIGDKSIWGQGYGTETLGLILRHGFRTLNLNRVYLRVYSDNGRAIRAYEKAGFVHEGRMRQAIYKHGNYQDVLLMSVLRREWDAREEA